MPPTPVFLISFNRGRMLRRAITGLRRLSGPVEIVIHDNGSTDGATLAVLAELEREGIRVVRRPPIRSADELNLVDRTVQDYFAERRDRVRYVVSDCDVDMSVADPRALEVYGALLTRFSHVGCVGPMLRIRDIPRAYPLYNRVMNRHIEQFWKLMPTLTETPFGQVAFLDTVIDTTLALHREGSHFRRQKPALRVYEPFEALHLDWYVMRGEESDYARSSHPEISHWNNDLERERHSDAPLDHAEYYAVRSDPSGSLEIYREHIGDR